MMLTIGKGADLFHAGYSILGGFANPTFSHETIQKTAGMRADFPGVQTSALWELVS